jgi:predicted DNA-binding transcriptional regulator AlpA
MPAQQKQDETEFDKLVTQNQLVDWLQSSRVGIDRMISAGRLPPPIMLGLRSKRWRVSEVEHALDRLRFAKR